MLIVAMDTVIACDMRNGKACFLATRLGILNKKEYTFLSLLRKYGVVMK